jgi:hypothetical protein
MQTTGAIRSRIGLKKNPVGLQKKNLFGVVSRHTPDNDASSVSKKKRISLKKNLFGYK